MSEVTVRAYDIVDCFLIGKRLTTSWTLKVKIEVFLGGVPGRPV